MAAKGGLLYLVGMMGAGKTTIGKKIAKALGVPFVDLDRVVEESTGVSVATVFEIEGETGFRERESQALARASESGDCVVATGGGVVLNPVNRARLCGTGYVVYLNASPELLYDRTRMDRTRPLLRVADPLARITELVTKRDPLYREVADLVVECSAGVGKTVGRIQQGYRLACRHSP